VNGPVLSGSAILRFVLVVLLFLLIGPPVGALTVAALFAVGLAGSTGDVEGGLWVAAFLSLYGVFLSWFIGWFPALIAGAIIGVRQAFFAPVPFWFAGLTGLGVGLGVGVAGNDLVLAEGEWGAPFILLVCLVPTLVCWLAAKLVGSAQALPPTPARGSPKAPGASPGGWNA
jgi:hypothetical protein